MQQKYLYPKIIELPQKLSDNLEFDSIEYVWDKDKLEWFCLIGFLNEYGYTTLHDEETEYSRNPCIALALACEKLIDKMEKK